MRCTKFALLIFGAGLLLGLAVVVAEIAALTRVASLLMALGIVALPIGAIADWRRAARPAGSARDRRNRATGQAAAVAHRKRQRRKPASPKR